MGLFVTFEGIEGCGKTTQILLAADYLAERGIPCLRTEEPGGTILGRKLREMLLNRGPFILYPETELLLFTAARAQHVREVILPALEEGKVVLCDRFADATLVYQGYARGLDIELISFLNSFVTNSLKPHLTLLFDLPVEVGLNRARERIARLNQASREDRFEEEDLTFHRKIREGYLLLAHQEKDRFRVIDAAGSVTDLQETVRFHLDTILGSDLLIDI
ncbi:MAG TPA: dTMP kinase [Syntrophus sp. (in: bacteria)]|jgi:dTMP kinase|nr:dTMP kinase [Syntrophus sp. (in: bacteria)]